MCLFVSSFNRLQIMILQNSVIVPHVAAENGTTTARNLLRRDRTNLCIEPDIPSWYSAPLALTVTVVSEDSPPHLAADVPEGHFLSPWTTASRRP